MKMIVVLLFSLLLFSSVDASAQSPCNTSNPSLVGCVDTPAYGATVDTSNGITLSGWTLSLTTKQQAAHVQGVYANGVGLLSPAQYVITWRVYRSDVADYFGVESPYLGYSIYILPNVVPTGTVVFGVNFVDPVTGIGLNSQQTTVNVVP